ELGTVLVLDDPEEIRRKFRSAVTDSGREIVRGREKAGISNLIEILAAARGVDPEEIEKCYADASGYADFKRDVGEAVAELLAPVRERYEAIRQDENALEDVLARGGERARAIASPVVAEARRRMGVGPLPR